MRRWCRIRRSAAPLAGGGLWSRLRGRSHLREARRAFRRVACAMTRASERACGSSWLSVESRRVALATIATPSRADAPRRRPVAAVRHATAAEAPATHWAGRQKARAALASATRLMSESDRASFAAYDVEFVVEISRCRAPLHRSTTQAPRHAADVELYSSTALYISTALQRATLYTLYIHPPSLRLHCDCVFCDTCDCSRRAIYSLPKRKSSPGILSPRKDSTLTLQG